MKFNIEMDIKGTLNIDVEADSLEDAEEKALEEYLGIDFSPLFECEGKIRYVWNEKGEIVKEAH